MVDALARCANHATGVVEQRIRVDTAGDRTARHDLLRHVVRTGDIPVLDHGRVRVLVHLDALAAARCKGGARAADVLGLAVPGAVDLLRAAEAIVRLGAAGHVRVAGVVGDAAAGLVADVGDPAVHAGAAAAVAGAGGAAVQDVLDRQVDVDPLRLARNLDAVAERRDGAVRPAGAAVLQGGRTPRLAQSSGSPEVGPGSRCHRERRGVLFAFARARGWAEKEPASPEGCAG
eukprot:COSAG06_NODE_7056_length_2653_cov_1.817933_2_plen_232_part_00